MLKLNFRCQMLIIHSPTTDTKAKNCFSYLYKSLMPEITFCYSLIYFFRTTTYNRIIDSLNMLFHRTFEHIICLTGTSTPTDVDSNTLSWMSFWVEGFKRVTHCRKRLHHILCTNHVFCIHCHYMSIEDMAVQWDKNIICGQGNVTCRIIATEIANYTNTRLKPCVNLNSGSIVIYAYSRLCTVLCD